MATMNAISEMLGDNLRTIIGSVVVFMGIRILTEKWRNRNRRSPPGLPSIPILGSLPWVPSDASHLTFTEFARKYGKLYTIDFGQQHGVVLNDYSSINEALVNQAVKFADRPSYHTTRYYNPRQKGLVAAHYDETFKRNKQASLKILRDIGFGNNVMEGRILSEVNDLIQAFVHLEAVPVDPGQLLYVSLSNIICALLFNKRFAYDDSRFRRALIGNREALKVYGDMVVIEFLPLLRYLPKFRKIIQALTENYRENVIRFINEEIQDHSQSHDASDNDSDFILTYKTKMADTLDRESLQFLAADFFGAGSDTSSTTLHWALVYLANNQDVQLRVHQEIDDVIGQGRTPSMSDRNDLRYVEAVLLETMRKSSIVPLALPHRLMADTELHGYFIKKGTVVYINLWAVHHDPDVWPDPEKFDPERFLDHRGHVHGREKVIAFSQGRRACLGEALARQELFLYFTSILQRFQVLPPPGQRKLSEEGLPGLVIAPKPQQLVLKSR